MIDAARTAACNAHLIAAAPDMRTTILALCDEMDRLVNALESGKSFAESWIEENGGIDGCDYQDRVSYENICAVLAACKAQPGED